MTTMSRVDTDYIDMAKGAARDLDARGFRVLADAIRRVVAGLERAEDEVGRLEQAARTIYLHDGRAILLGSEAEAIDYRKAFARKYQDALILLTEIAHALGVRFRDMDDEREIVEWAGECRKALAFLGEIGPALGLDPDSEIDLDEILAAIQARSGSAPEGGLARRFGESFGKIAEALGLEPDKGVHLDDILSEIESIKADAEDAGRAADDLDTLAARLARVFGVDFGTLKPVRWRSMFRIVEGRVREMTDRIARLDGDVEEICEIRASERDEREFAVRSEAEARRQLDVANAAREALETKLRAALDERDAAIRGLVSRDKEDGWKVIHPDYYVDSQAQRLYAIRESLRKEREAGREAEPVEPAEDVPATSPEAWPVREARVTVVKKYEHEGSTYLLMRPDDGGRSYYLLVDHPKFTEVARGQAGTLRYREGEAMSRGVEFVPDASADSKAG